MSWLLWMLVAWAAFAVLLVLMRAVLRATRRRRQAWTRLHELNQLRSPSGTPFFPNTPEGRRREARVLRGWDPDFDD
jgi:hypothetical protein